MEEILISEEMPVLALRGLAVFPKQTLHFDVGRKKSIRAVDKAMKGDQLIFLVPQKNIMDDDPDYSKLCPVGTVAKIKQVLKSQNDMVRVLVEGLYRGEITLPGPAEPCLSGRIESLQEPEVTFTPKVEALVREAYMGFSTFLELIQKPAQELQLRMLTSGDPGFVADVIGQNLTFDIAERITLLSQLHPVKRLETAIKFMYREIDVLHAEKSARILPPGADAGDPPGAGGGRRRKRRRGLSEENSGPPSV